MSAISSTSFCTSGSSKNPTCIGLDQPHQLHRMGEIEPALRVDADLDLVADRLTQRLDAACVVAHDLDHWLLAAQVVEAGRPA